MVVPIRRIVSGMRSDGTQGVIEDGQPPHVVTIDAERGLFRTDIWSSSTMPYDNGDPADPTLTWPDDLFSPLPNGTACFVMEIPPDDPESPPDLHRTDTLDYIVILRGEIHAIFADEERLVKAGDILVQRGTPHGWSNRSGQPCTFLAVMLDARQEPTDVAACRIEPDQQTNSSL